MINPVKAVVLKNDGQWFEWRKNFLNEFNKQNSNNNITLGYDPKHYPVIVAFGWAGVDDKEITIVECEKYSTKIIEITIA